MSTKFLLILLMVISLFSCNNATTKNETSAKQGVYFVNLKEGESVKSPFIVEMGVDGMEIEPAGEINKGKGHHHIVIDGSFIAEGTMVPADDNHIHYGKGQTSDKITLTTGKHTLTLQLADGIHQSYGKAWSKTISVEVTE